MSSGGGRALVWQRKKQCELRSLLHSQAMCVSVLVFCFVEVFLHTIKLDYHSPGLIHSNLIVTGYIDVFLSCVFITDPT